MNSSIAILSCEPLCLIFIGTFKSKFIYSVYLVGGFIQFLFHVANIQCQQKESFFYTIFKQNIKDLLYHIVLVG